MLKENLVTFFYGSISGIKWGLLSAMPLVGMIGSYRFPEMDWFYIPYAATATILLVCEVSFWMKRNNHL